MTIVSTPSGQLRGTDTGSTVRFAGVPFAQPPVGDLRWRPPVPIEPWEGVRDATAVGPIAPQNPDMLTAFLGLDAEPHDEDCLYLNVATPAVDAGARPVMVWIHGGAFMIGSGSNELYEGRTLVERGDVVLVTINYRLGAFGFLELGWLDADYAGSGNLGLLDQVAALEWVRDNIASFGGDPDNVTIFGESAGGMSVTCLLAIDRAKGLFHKAIAQSGAAQASATPELAEASGREFAAGLAAMSIDDLRATSRDRLLEVQGQLIIAAMTNVGTMLEHGVGAAMPFRPVEDGRVLPRSVLAAIRSGSAAGVPLVTGTTKDEWKLFALMDFEAVDDQVLRRRLDALTGDADKALAVYGESTAADPKALFSVVLTDLAFRYPAIQLGEAQLEVTPEVYEYVFSWPSPQMAGMLGSCHAIELPFLFGLAADKRLVPFLGDAAPLELASALQDAWLTFARTGQPGPDWPRYDTERRAVMELGAERKVLEDPGAAEREFWSSIDT